MRRVTIGILTGVVGLAGIVVSGCSDASSTSSPLPVPLTPSSTVVPTTVESRSADNTSGRRRESFDVDGMQRTAIVVRPESRSDAAPVVFVFHGHGGSGANIERKFDIEALWPEAIVVYPDGLVGHKGKTDPAGVKSGWQTVAGESGDRDLAFYDTMLKWLLATVPVDSDRVYAMGHSNGSAFVSLLLNRRGAAIAATANLSSQPSARLLATDPTRSMFMAMGMTDPIVPYANQKRAIPIAERKIGANPSAAVVAGDLTTEQGRDGLELETYIYPGGHEPPAEVPQLVVTFFRRQSLNSSAPR